MGTQLPSGKGAQPPSSPKFSPHVRCGQTAGWTKVPLGMEVGLGPGDFVLDGDPAPLRKKMTQPPPNFWPMSINVATVAYKSQLLLSYCLWAEVHNVSAIHSEMHPAYGDKCFIRPDRQHTRCNKFACGRESVDDNKGPGRHR